MTYFFYRRELREGRKDREILESLIDADIRLRDDTARAKMKRGKIVKRNDGTYGINWTINLTETIKVGAKVKVEKEEKD